MFFLNYINKCNVNIIKILIDVCFEFDNLILKCIGKKICVKIVKVF